ncbi:LysR family transcriptional regulator [Spongiibacter sp. KMU-158]|uniref:LysR family transcriptional regulator n=1 Tax=Spongiibacter pelagi TaxID=2760804 RepID=A0A927C1K3_9GAMM|nr:LysR family transcriptional regulator [Spongiibacter pelagi]MBD2859589.1 LysR family transcriptional regulator [Spongiibacter pelagi]
MKLSHLNRLTLRQLDVFLAVCQQRSYSRAAEQLALTQPAVSAQIRSLETLIQQPLFDYIGKQLFLTKAGELVERAARDLKQRLINLEIELNELHGRLAGRLNLAIETSAEQLLPRYIQRFSERHPEVEIVLQVENHQGLLRRLSDNLDDLAVLTRVPGDRGLNFTPFAEHQLLAVACPNHPLTQRSDVSLMEVLGYTLLARESGSGSAQIFEDFCQQQSCVIKRRRQLGSNQAILHSLLAQSHTDDHHYAILPKLLVEEEIRMGRLKTIEVNSMPIRRSWCSAYPRGKHLNPVAEAFLKNLHMPL